MSESSDRSEASKVPKVSKISDESEASNSANRGLRILWPTLIVTSLFGILYAYDLFEAASNLFGVTAQLADYNAFASENDLAVRSVPWAVLIANLLLAPVGFVSALVLGRRRILAVKALVLVAGLCVTAAVSLSFAAFV